MESVSRGLLIAAASVIGAGLIGFAIVSVRERERRAAMISVLLVPVMAIPPVIVARWSGAGSAILLTIAGIAALWLIFPGRAHTPPNGRPGFRVDERDIMFARARLEPGTPEYESFYAMRPEHEQTDARIRALPGLLSLDARKADPVEFAEANRQFAITEELRDSADGPVAQGQAEWPPERASAEIKEYALECGALDVGIAELRPYHVYTHVGRGTGNYGAPIDLPHRWAVAFTVEMDHRTMQTAPEAPVVAESARRYVDAARIAIAVADRIRAAGAPARAHIDGNYRVIAPLVALDAGLGEIGRMGILMTPRLGPRVRLGVVTTDLPLIADVPGDAPSVVDFCTRCEKCVDNCPSNAIPRGPREQIAGGLRWTLDAEACFRYWNVIGTDCGKCMAVCPFSHPDNPAHNLVRWMIGASPNARRAALALDDVFYGRTPRSADPAG